MDANEQQALIENLAESSRRSADAIEQLGAQMVALRGQVQTIDERMGELRKLQHESAERVERLASEVDRLRADRSLGAQIEALRGSQTEAQSRLEGLEGKLRRVEQVEASMGQMQREIGSQIEDRERALRSEIEAQSRQRGDDGAQVARELRSLEERVEKALAYREKLEVLEHGRNALSGEIEDLTERLEALDERGTRAGAERQKRSQHAASSQIEGERQRIDALEEVVGGWQERIERQLETLQESQAIAQQMQQEAERLRRESHAAAEAWRVAEGRVDEHLAQMRQDIEERAQRLEDRRRNGWEAHGRLHESERREEREAREAAIAQIEETMDGLRQELQTGLEVTGRDIAEVKHRLGGYFRSLQQQLAETAETFEVNLPSDDPAAVDPERRQALRRALRARRAARGG